MKLLFKHSPLVLVVVFGATSTTSLAQEHNKRQQESLLTPGQDTNMKINLLDANGNKQTHEFKVKATKKTAETIIFPINTQATLPWIMRGYKVSQ